MNALPAKVYEAWTDAKKIPHWFGPENAEVLRATADVRVGGRFRIVFRGPDGEEHDVGGTYREVVPNEKLVFTWAWRTTPERESLVTIAAGTEHSTSSKTMFAPEIATMACPSREGRRRTQHASRRQCPAAGLWRREALYEGVDFNPPSIVKPTLSVT
jgi:uncharacterized protein YndB with AHSA1/START domain